MVSRPLTLPAGFLAHRACLPKASLPTQLGFFVPCIAVVCIALTFFIEPIALPFRDLLLRNSNATVLNFRPHGGVDRVHDITTVTPRTE